MEEASRLDTDVFYEVVVPLLGVSNTSILAISTPLGEDNYYSQITQIKDENKRPLFKSLSIQLICDACKAKKKDAVQCVHRLDMLPSWKSEARQEKVRRIMETVPELYMREALGVTTSERFGVFTSGQLENLGSYLTRTSRRLDSKKDDVVFVSIDPTGGGASKLAIISSVCTDGRVALVSTT
tara:strand:- start:5046 stop:5594 length:549 start_codon:yes stop_codon:yes gene_type:complete